MSPVTCKAAFTPAITKITVINNIKPVRSIHRPFKKGGMNSTNEMRATNGIAEMGWMSPTNETGEIDLMSPTNEMGDVG